MPGPCPPPHPHPQALAILEYAHGNEVDAFLVPTLELCLALLEQGGATGEQCRAAVPLLQALRGSQYDEREEVAGLAAACAAAAQGLLLRAGATARVE